VNGRTKGQLVELVDERIRRSIVDQLFWDDRVNAADIDVDVSGGWVILVGKVATNQVRTAADQMVLTIQGVQGVSNDLVVRPE
jgi:osmotically-inducible protein OsmY